MTKKGFLKKSGCCHIPSAKKKPKKKARENQGEPRW